MTLFQAAVLGIVQGITEFMPVSSTGHLMILKQIFGVELRHLDIDISVHFGTLLAVFVYFRKDIRNLLISVVNTASTPHKKLFPLKYVLFLLLGSIPLGVTGFLFESYFNQITVQNSTLYWAFFFTGILLVISELASIRLKKRKLGYISSFIVGLGQAFAVIPGLSRSGITISIGMLLGIERDDAARYSIFLGAISILGASLYLVLKQVSTDRLVIDPVLLFVSAFTAFITAYIGIDVLIKLVIKGKLWMFGIYSIVLAGILIAFQG
jgi:undecaprenyl-diphosphatase|tara:strand:- start:2520 stop:3320 length:801 start_codon:yes stop_codon:yes gene_type:complete